MEYRETGLPQDVMVFKAFTAFNKNVERPDTQGMPVPAAIIDEMVSFPVRIAQVLNTAGQGPQLMSLALLNVMPPETYSVVEKQFGADMVALVKEAGTHQRTGFAYINEASDPIKLLTLASSIASFDDFTRMSGQIEQQLDSLMMGDAPANGQLMIPTMPDTKIYDRLSESLLNQTSSPTLEGMFTDKLVDFRMANDRLKDKLSAAGLDQQMGMMGMGLPGGENEFRYPSFEETKLLDDPKVRAAYSVLINDSRVYPEDFEAAIEVAQTLSTVPATKNPLSIAGALLDVGVRELGPDDFGFLGKKLDWDVIDLLKDNGIRRVRSPQDILKAPEEFRQIVVANAAVSVGQMKLAGEKMEEMMQEQQVPKEIMPIFLAQNLRQIAAVSSMLERTLKPVIGQTGAPEIDTLFTSNLTALRELIAEKAPKRGNPFDLDKGNDNSPFPPKKKGFGNDFSLD